MLHVEVLRLAGSQSGFVTRSQLAELGWSPDQVHWRVRTGSLVRASAEVLSLPGAPDTRARRHLLATLDAGPGAALSHGSALVEWDLQRSSGSLHVVRARRAGGKVSAHHVATVHQVRDLHPSHTVSLRGLRVTSPARTVLDIATRWPPAAVARIIDRGLALRVLGLGELGVALGQVRGRGRKGVRVVEELLAERRDVVPTDSALETRFARIMRDHGLPEFARQVHLSDETGWITRADFVHEALGVVVLVDGDIWHATLTDKLADDLVTARIESTGRTVVRVSESQVCFEPLRVAGRVRRALERAATSTA